jgi:hypothetical protein
VKQLLHLHFGYLIGRTTGIFDTVFQLTRTGAIFLNSDYVEEKALVVADAHALHIRFFASVLLDL